MGICPESVTVSSFCSIKDNWCNFAGTSHAMSYGTLTIISRKGALGETENRTQSIGCVPSGQLSFRPNKTRRKEEPVHYQFPKFDRQKDDRESRKECVPYRYQFRS